MSLTDRIRRSYARAFGGVPEIAARAPGRVKLIGEHVDYGDGFVLPMAIDAGTLVLAARGGDGVKVVAADYGDERHCVALNGPVERRAEPGWANHVRGVVAALQARGTDVPPCRLAIGGDVPRGAGLSSSASLGVAAAAALARLAGAELDRTALALIAQASEVEFVGTNCGIMDQLVVARGAAGAALLIDCRSLEARPVPVPDDWAVLVVDSGIERRLADGAYNDRRREVEAAARHYNVSTLRELTQARLVADRGRLDGTLFRRARHQVTENARTLAAAQAIGAGDLPKLGRLMAASHASLRDDFAVSVPAMDALVALLQDAIGDAGGARMTGGGFGGSVVAVCARDRVGAVRSVVQAGYRTPDGRPPTVTPCRASAGLCVRPA